MEPQYMSRNLLRCAVIYALLSAVLTVVMAFQQHLLIGSIYLHIHLTGWVSMALMALTYRVFPDLTHCPWCKVQFWAHNLGLPILLLGIYAIAHQLPFGSVCTFAGSILVLVAFIAFTINAWRNAN